jgi:hypothetical protein
MRDEVWVWVWVWVEVEDGRGCASRDEGEGVRLSTVFINGLFAVGLFELKNFSKSVTSFLLLWTQGIQLHR